MRDMSKEKEILTEEVEQEQENSFDDIEYALSLMQLDEEAIRIENFTKEFKVDEQVLTTNYYKKGIVQAETLVAMCKLMVNNGVDYNNSLSLAASYMTNEHNLELAKIQSVQAQQNQI